MSSAVTLTLTQVGLGVLGLGTLQFLASLLISERLKASLQQETGKFLEALRWELKAREQAAKVAEYMALARDLRPDSPVGDYREANRLAWELALWLPANVYRSVGKAIAAPDSNTNTLSVVIDVRRVLLGEAAGDLVSDNIIHHAPGIGKRPTTTGS